MCEIRFVGRTFSGYFCSNNVKSKLEGQIFNTLGFRSKTLELEQSNKEYHMKVLLSSVHLNGHTLGFHL